MMNYSTITLCFFLFMASAVFAQFDASRFEEVFDEELDETSHLAREHHSGRYQFVSAQNVPDWFIHPPVSDEQAIYSIGISDPGLDSVQATELALYRAEVLANVFHESTTQLLCDFFLDEAQQASNIVYENYSRIVAHINDNSNPYELVHLYQNEFDEVIVLIKYHAEILVADGTENTILCEVYKNETESSIYGDYESVYEMKVKTDSLSVDFPLLYQLTELGPRSSVSVVVDTIGYDMPIYSLSYANLPSLDTVKTMHFSHGLWKEYYKALTTQIVSNARQKPENVSVLSDRYQTESYQKLTRGISQNRMRFVLQGVSVKSNQLHVDLLEVPLTSY